MDEMYLKALAKINLGLDVIRKREDGYHEVKMVMQTLKMYDRINIKKINRKASNKKDIYVTTNLPYLPSNENNLVYKAAKLLMDEFDINQGVSINLFKYIPVAAGMAGGSSDAAAVLYGMNRMFRLGLSMEELMERGVKIGADVPYCLMRGTALAEGIGEKLTILPSCPSCYIVIAKPPISVSTKFVYENLHANELTTHPDIEGLIHCMENNDLVGMCNKMGNVLETVTIPAYPVIEAIKKVMLEQGAIGAMMSGSGPTVFGIFQELEKAEQTYQILRQGDLANQVYLTEPYNIPRKE